MLARLCLVLTVVSSAPAAVDFARDVAPILESRCQLCHGENQQMSGLRLDRPIDAAKAPNIVTRITSTKAGFRMPPIGDPLSEAQIAALKEWASAGAPWPDNYRAAAAKPLHWAFRPIEDPAPPSVKNSPWPRNPIDNFVLAKLESLNIPPSKEADKLTLLRRVTFDLTGLPPTPQEIDEFLADKRPDAYDRVVDRLFASPHYGERWARPWLDLARYADSDGYEKDKPRPYAWRYRHWLINALNDDLPFDEFTIDQIAGDLLPNATTEQRVATGFHRNTLTNREAGVDRAEDRFEQLVNRVNTVTTTWLAFTVGCAQCHNHKYDPISQKDFYRFFAFFDSAAEEDIEAPLPGEREVYEMALPRYLAHRGHLLDLYDVPKLQQEWEDKLRSAIASPGKNLEWDFSITSMRAMFDNAEKVLLTPAAKRSRHDQERLTDYFLSNIGPDYGRLPDVRSRLRDARDKIEALSDELPPYTMAATLVRNPNAQPTHLRVRGDYRTPGEVVEAGTPSALPEPPTRGPETRLDLARWIVSKENPLTARVIVNRAWQEFFGRGLVLTSEDFGTQGDKPTHPQLLDWLATSFREDGWSMKRLHRRIVTSATYRQGSDARPELETQDPDNSLLARQMRKRLPAENIRDAALLASGLLDPTIGGPSIRPYLPPGVAELGYANNVKWNESPAPERYRRGLYIHFQRTTPYPQLMNFDEPDSNVACSRRRRSNTPLQALNLLNDPVFYEAAQAMAAKLLDAGPDFAARLDNAFERALGRKPDAAERQRLARYYDEQLSILDQEPQSLSLLAHNSVPAAERREAAAWTGICRILLNTDEFMTRE